jgi:hypothetical protein
MRKIIGWAAAGCLAGSALAMPADAHEWRGHYHYHHHGDGGFGDFVAGAVLVGGIAALVSAIHGNDRARQDAAVDRCAHEAESRTGGQVADIVHVGNSKGYYTIEGTLDGGFDGPPPGDRAAPPPPPGPLSFRCVVHDGTIYSFRATPGEA